MARYCRRLCFNLNFFGPLDDLIHWELQEVLIAMWAKNLGIVLSDRLSDLAGFSASRPNLSVFCV